MRIYIYIYIMYIYHVNIMDNNHPFKKYPKVIDNQTCNGKSTINGGLHGKIIVEIWWVFHCQFHYSRLVIWELDSHTGDSQAVFWSQLPWLGKFPNLRILWRPKRPLSWGCEETNMGLIAFKLWYFKIAIENDHGQWVFQRENDDFP